MRLPLHRPISTDRAPIPLTGTTKGHKRFAEIANPDTMFPVDHSVNPTDPHVNADAFRQQIIDTVSALAARGALDQDTLEALSELITSWLHTWIPLAYRTARSRREVAELLLAQIIQNQHEVSVELRALHKRRGEVTAARKELMRELGLPNDVLSPSNDTDTPVAPASRIRKLRESLRTHADQTPVFSADAHPPTGPLPVPLHASHPAEPPLPSAGFTASTPTQHPSL